MQIYGGSRADGYYYDNVAIVDGGGALRVFDPSGAAPTVSVASDYKISGTHTGIGSASLVAGDYGGSVWPIRIFNGSFVMVAGSISSMPSVTATNSANYTISGLLSDAGSLTLIGAERAGSVYPIRLDLGSFLMVAGSISSMPTISVSTGSEVYVKGGSIHLYSGTSYIDVPNRVAGSIVNLPVGSNFTLSSPGSINVVSLSGTIYSYLGVGSVTGQVTIGAGSVQTYNPVGVGSVTGVITVRAGSIQPYSQLGSVNSVIYGTSGTDIGFYPILTTSGTEGGNLIVNQGTSPWAVSGVVNIGANGSVRITNASFGSAVYIPAGSIALINSLGSTEIFGNITASPASDYKISGTHTGIGSASLIAGDYGGSVWPLRIWNGSFLMIAGSISSVPTTPISGIVNQGTTPWSISGVANWGLAVGSVTILSSTGSIEIYQTTSSDLTISGVISNRVAGSIVNLPIGSNFLLSTPGSIGVYDADNGGISVEPARGVFAVSGASFIASGTMTNIYTPGTGSKLFLKGFTASAELATQFRLLFSGGTPTQLSHFTLPNSGTVAMNFLGMEPSGAVNQPISVGLFNGGSLYLTIFGKESL